MRAEKIKCAPTTDVSRADARQPTIAAALQSQVANATTPVNRVRDGLLREIRHLKWRLESARASLDFSDTAHPRNKLCFKQLLKDKRSRNNRQLPLPSVGVAKLKQLMALGINNAVDLLEFEDVNNVFWSHRTRNAKLNSWQTEAKQFFNAKKRKTRDLKAELKCKEDELNAITSYRDIDDALEPARRELDSDTNTATDTTVSVVTLLPSLFSEMTDPLGYNARFVTAGQVNSMQETEFGHRKPMQDAKMMGLSGQMLKIDWSYKVAGKTHVYTGPGQCFKPHTNILNVKNEDGLTLSWKAADGGESLLPLKPDLLRLKLRNARLNATTKGVYIDDCCKHRNGLQGIFGKDCFVNLDPFHWQCRWDRALAKPKSENGAIFRSSMSQALFVTPTEECTNAKNRLIARHRKRKNKSNNYNEKWEPAARQIRKEACSVIPNPTKLRSVSQLWFVISNSATWRLMLP